MTCFAVVIVYDYWLQDIEARSIFHFFSFSLCRWAQVFWHKACIIFSSFDPHWLLIDFCFSHHRRCCCWHHSVSIDFHCYRALCTHILPWWFRLYYVSEMCLSHSKSIEFIVYTYTYFCCCYFDCKFPIRCEIEQSARYWALIWCMFLCVPNWRSSQIKLNEIVSL